MRNYLKIMRYYLKIIRWYVKIMREYLKIMRWYVKIMRCDLHFFFFYVGETGFHIVMMTWRHKQLPHKKCRAKIATGVIHLVSPSNPGCICLLRTISIPVSNSRAEEEQRMMVSTPPTSPSAPERLAELRGTTFSTQASSSKRPVSHMGESMTFKD